MPSFNCEAADLSITEMAICSNDDLVRYDRELAGLYQARMRSAAPADKQTLQQDERAWLQKRGACGGSLDCIKGAYLTKIYDLQTSSVPAFAPAPAPAPAYAPKAGGDQAAQVNAAIPLSGTAQDAFSDARKLVRDKTFMASIESQLALKMSLRALNCIQSLNIATGLSKQQIHDNYSGSPCFARQDDDIRIWLGMRTVGYVLTLPPLRPMPAVAPQSITDRAGSISLVYFATQAGVAVVQSAQDVEVVDLGRDSPVSTRLRQDDIVTGISPNGRIYVSYTNHGLRFYDTEDGTLLADSGLNQYATACAFPWLDPMTMVTRDPNSYSTSVLYDFSTGTYTPTESEFAYVSCFLPVPGTSDISVAYGANLTKFRLTRAADGKPQIDVLQAKPAGRANLARDDTALGPGGWEFFYITDQRLGITDLSNLSSQTVDFGNYAVQHMWPTNDPDKIIISGVMKHRTRVTSAPTPLYVYAIKEQTLSALDTASLVSQRFVYDPLLNTLYAIKDSALTRVDSLQTGTPEPIATFWTDVAKYDVPPPALPNLNNLPPGVVIMTPDGQVTRVIGNGQPSHARPQVQSQPPADALHLLAQNASVEGVSIMEPDSDRASPAVGTVVRPSSAAAQIARVTVRSRRNPVILVLVAQSNVTWQLNVAPGAQLMAVLLSGAGAGGSVVQGQGNTPVVNIGSTYSFTPGMSPPDDRPGYQDLQMEVYAHIGKRISLFQGGTIETTFNIY